MLFWVILKLKKSLSVNYCNNFIGENTKELSNYFKVEPPVRRHTWDKKKCPLNKVLMGGEIKRFSIECRKTKTKEITMANQNKGKYHKGPVRTQSKYM